jgi:hypothetical protein
MKLVKRQSYLQCSRCTKCSHIQYDVSYGKTAFLIQGVSFVVVLSSTAQRSAAVTDVPPAINTVRVVHSVWPQIFALGRRQVNSGATLRYHIASHLSMLVGTVMSGIPVRQ